MTIHEPFEIGVADPATVNFLLSEADIEVERVVTLVDSQAFPGMWQSEAVREGEEGEGRGLV